MNSKQRVEWDNNSYKAKLAANKGHNYQYWNDDLQKMIDNKEWFLYDDFTGYEKHSTSSESLAKSIAIHYRHTGHYARVVCGYLKNQQNIKMFSVIYGLALSKHNSKPNKSLHPAIKAPSK